MRTNLRAIAEAAAANGPERALLDAVGDLTDYEVFHNFVLVAQHIAPQRVLKGPNGEDVILYRTDRDQEEDRYQGKVHLVLKAGPLAFSEEVSGHFTGDPIQPGDWVVLRGSDAYDMFIKDRRKTNEGVAVRLVEDTLIKMRVSDPSLIY